MIVFNVLLEQQNFNFGLLQPNYYYSVIKLKYYLFRNISGGTMKPIRNQLIRLAVLGCLTSTLTITASAQNTIEEVYVTATKRQQTLQEVPVAVSVTDADTIEKAQILDIQDLQSVVPSLRITQLQSSANTNFVIRGFGNGANNAGIEPSVGVFIDGVYRSRSAGAISDLPNLERVEVLRGPQSTLFGKNASAGVISVVTAKPSQDFSGSAELTLGNFGQTVLRGDVTNGITENLAFSLSGSVNQRDGYFDDLVSGQEANERDRYGVRGQLLWTPTENSEFRVIADHNSLDENCCGVTNLQNGPTGGAVALLGGTLVPDDAFSYAYAINEPSANALEDNGISLQGKLSSDDYDLISITSQRFQRLDTAQDSDFTSLDILGKNSLNQDIDTFTQEFRISSAGDTDINWMLGYFLLKEDVSAVTDIQFGNDFRAYADVLTGNTTGNPANGALGAIEGALFGPAAVGNVFQAPGTGAVDTSTQENTSQSLFGQVDWQLSDSLVATFGLNHTRDEKEVRVTQANTDVYSSIDLFNDFGGAIPNAFFGQAFFDATNLAPTAANVGFVNTLPAGAFGAAFPGSGAQLIAALQAGVTAGIQGLQGLQFLPPFLNYPNGVEDGQSKDSATTYTVRLAADVNDNANAYISIGTGFKATSWNLSRDSRPFPTSIQDLTDAGLITSNLTTGTRFASPEDAKVLEIGYKAKYDKGALNLAAFTQSIEGFQSNIFTGTGFALANAGKQTTFGFEWDGLYQATDNLTLTTAGTYLSAKYDSFPGATGLNGPTDLSGQVAAGIHPLSMSTSATYDMEFSNGWNGFLRADYLYESSVRMLDNVPEELATRQVNTLNAAFGVEMQNGWQATLWGRNITDDQYLLSAFPTTIQAGSYSGYPNQPRTYGLTVKKNF